MSLRELSFSSPSPNLYPAYRAVVTDSLSEVLASYLTQGFETWTQRSLSPLQQIVSSQPAPDSKAHVALSGHENDLATVNHNDPAAANHQKPPRTLVVLTEHEQEAHELISACESAGFIVYQLGFDRDDYAQCNSYERVGDVLIEFASWDLPNDTIVVGHGRRTLLELATSVASQYKGGLPLALIPTTLYAALTVHLMRPQLSCGEMVEVAGHTYWPIFVAYDFSADKTTLSHHTESSLADLSIGSLLTAIALGGGAYDFKRLHSSLVTSKLTREAAAKLIPELIVDAWYTQSTCITEVTMRTGLATSPGLRLGSVCSRVLDELLLEAPCQRGYFSSDSIFATQSAYEDALRAEGLRLELELAYRSGYLDEAVYESACELLDFFGCSKIPCELDPDELTDCLEEQQPFVILSSIGHVEPCFIDEDHLKSVVERFCEERFLLLPYEMCPSRWESASFSISDEEIEHWEQSYNSQNPLGSPEKDIIS